MLGVLAMLGPPQAASTQCALLSAVDTATGQAATHSRCERNVTFGCDAGGRTMWVRKGCSGIFACGAHTVACALPGLECACQSEEQRREAAFHAAAAFDAQGDSSLLPARLEEVEMGRGGSFARNKPCRTYAKVAACGIEYDEWMMVDAR
tara:strand:+ start:584 stop:1033 length:450 start_codon:yes stop_codon:yes gene_type:complete